MVQRAAGERSLNEIWGEATHATVWAGLWGWREPRFIVELPYPAAAGDAEVRARAVPTLLEAGFESWRDKLLTRYLPLAPEMLTAPDLEERVVRFANESFNVVARSGILDLAATVVVEADDDDEQIVPV